MKSAKKILLASCFFLLYACGEYRLDSEESLTPEEEQTDIRYTLQLDVSSDDNAKINYPLSLFIFDEKNNCISRESIPAESHEYSASMAKGKYTFILLSGLNESDYSYPLEIIPDSYISFKANNRSDKPLQMGKASVNLTQSTRITVVLSYVVSSISFTLNGIPQEATSTEISVSPVSSGISFSGDYKNDRGQSVIPCRKEGLRWFSDAVYIFPNESSQTHLSVNIRLPQGNEAYGYTYQATLKAGYPYHFTGNYKEGIALDGEFQAEGWQPEIDCEFGFDEISPGGDDDEEENKPGNTEGDETPDDDAEYDTFIVSEMPESDSVWGYFYVWQVHATSSGEAEAVIIAPEQWYALAADAADLLAGYSEDGIGGWRMFTTEEAVAFRAQYQSSLNDLNKFIGEYGISGFKNSDGARYLCNNAQSTFSFANNRVIDAGKTVKYYLRAVKTVRFKLE